MLQIDPSERITPKEAIKHPFFSVSFGFNSIKAKKFMSESVDTYYNEFSRESSDDFEKLDVLSASSSSIIDEN